MFLITAQAASSCRRRGAENEHVQPHRAHRIRCGFGNRRLGRLFLPPLSCIINPQANIVNTYLKIYFGNKHFFTLVSVLLRPNAKLLLRRPRFGKLFAPPASFAALYSDAFSQNDGIILMPAQTPAVQNYNALIKHHIRQLTVIPDIGGLHQYAVFDFCTLADMNSAEKYGIFDFTLDNAAVRNNAVARTAAAAVIRGHLILDFV